MSWVLFIVIVTFNGAATTSQEFSTPAACDSAAENVRNELKAPLNEDNYRVFCLSKATGDAKRD